MGNPDNTGTRELRPYQMFNGGGVDQNFAMTVEKVSADEVVEPVEAGQKPSPEAEPIPTPTTPKPPVGSGSRKSVKVEEKEISPEEFELSIDEPSA